MIVICLNEQSYEKLLDTNYPQPIALKEHITFPHKQYYKTFNLTLNLHTWVIDNGPDLKFFHLLL